MDKLSETWMVDGTIDFEAKKYTLLAYLQKVKECFDNTKVYPQLSDLFFHHNNLVSFKDNKNYLKDHFPKKLSGIQIENLELIYEEMIADNNLMQEIEEIVHYANQILRECGINRLYLFMSFEKPYSGSGSHGNIMFYDYERFHLLGSYMN